MPQIGRLFKGVRGKKKGGAKKELEKREVKGV